MTSIQQFFESEFITGICDWLSRIKEGPVRMHGYQLVLYQRAISSKWPRGTCSCAVADLLSLARRGVGWFWRVHPIRPSTPYITPTKTFTIIRHFQSPRITEGFRYASDNAFPSPIRAHRLAPRVNLGSFWVIDKWWRVSLLPQILAYSEKKSLSFRWMNTLLIPLIATFISGGSLLVRVVLRLWSRSRRAQNVLKPREGLSEDEAEQTMVGRLQKQSKSQGGLVIVAFKTTRFLCCLALFSLSLLSIIVEESGHRNLELTGIFEGVNVSELAVAFTFVCCRTFFRSGLPLISPQFQVVFIFSSVCITYERFLESVNNATQQPGPVNHLRCIRLSWHLATRYVFARPGGYLRRTTPLG